jgi:hypothetical protein
MSSAIAMAMTGFLHTTQNNNGKLADGEEVANA